MTVWPDVPASPGGGKTVRELLDYVVWIAGRMERLGAHGGLDLDPWRQRVHQAYVSLVDSMAPGHGDPLPPDVPPSIEPGTWPDVAAVTVPGMTVRHQLTVLGTIAAGARSPRSHQQPADSERWAQRVLAAYDALDHGPTMTLPAEARTTPPPAAVTSKHAKTAKGRAKKPGSKSKRAGKAKPAKPRRPVKKR